MTKQITRTEDGRKMLRSLLSILKERRRTTSQSALSAPADSTITSSVLRSTISTLSSRLRRLLIPPFLMDLETI